MQHRRGFTLIELIVVVIMLGVLLAIVAPRLLSSTDDANAKLIVKAVKDIRDAVAIAKMKCLSELNAVGAAGTPDTQQLLDALASDNCQILPRNAYEVDSQNYAKVKDLKIRTDFRNPNNDIVVEIDCNGNDSICSKTRTQLNEMYGSSACPNAPANGILVCTLPLSEVLVMNMLLLVGVSVGFALSVLASNSFYSEKTFTTSAHSAEKKLSKIFTRPNNPTQSIR